MQCHTVMKTVRCMEYEQQEITCHKTCWDRVCEDRVINCVKYVPETRSRESLLHGLQAGLGNQDRVCYTVCKPVWETKTREICYTVCKPVLGNQDRAATRSASRSGRTTARKFATRSASRFWETKTRTLHGLQAGWETKSREDLLHGLQAGVGRPDPHATRSASRCGKTKTREICYTVRKPVHYTKTIQVPSGHWETQTYEVPGPVVRKTRPRAWYLDVRSLLLPLLLLPWQVPHRVCAVPAGRTCCKKVWVPECIDERDLLHEVRVRTAHEDLLLQGLPHGAGSSGPAATRSATWCPSNAPRPAATRSATWCRKQRTCCYKVCHMVPEQRTCTCARRSASMVPEQRTCCYKVCHMVPEQRIKTCCYKVCHMVPEQRTCSYKVCHMVPEQRTRTVCYTVCKPVCYQRRSRSRSACRAACPTR